MLEHAGEALLVFVGAWRFVFSPGYRSRKLAEWRDARRTLGGQATIVTEIVAAVALGVLLPLWLIVLVAF